MPRVANASLARSEVAIRRSMSPAPWCAVHRTQLPRLRLPHKPAARSQDGDVLTTAGWGKEHEPLGFPDPFNEVEGAHRQVDVVRQDDAAPLLRSFRSAQLTQQEGSRVRATSGFPRPLRGETTASRPVSVTTPQGKSSARAPRGSRSAPATIRTPSANRSKSAWEPITMTRFRIRLVLPYVSTLQIVS